MGEAPARGVHARACKERVPDICQRKEGSTMKIVKEAAEKTGEDLYTEKYEFRACGGSIEPEDKVENAKEDLPREENNR